MSFLDRIGKIFGKREERLPEPVIPSAMEPTKFETTAESATIDNVKAKMDLVLTQLDSLRVQYQVLNEKVTTMEKILQELYKMAKS
jgi:hypothetical protein